MPSKAAAFERDPGAPLPDHEVFGPTLKSTRGDLTIPKISYGLSFDKAIVNHVEPTARIYILASRSLAENTDNLDRLRAALGDRVQGLRVGMTPHTLFQECVDVAAEARRVRADTVVTLGAGSLSDAAKFVCKALTNDLSTVAQLERHVLRVVDGKWVGPAQEGGQHKQGNNKNNNNNPPGARLIFIPTSLSAGEHTPYAGITDRDTEQKYQIMAAQAHVTIYDPALTLTTPASVWLQSGVRGIDHAIEAIVSAHAFPEVLDAGLRGLQLLVPGLLGSHRDGGNLEARLNAQIGVSLTILPITWGVPAGASHGIGHMLGPMGVGHGETSCILLPAVCKYNARVTEKQQGIIRKTLWDIPLCADLCRQNGLSEEMADLGDLLNVIIRALGMPRTLKEKGVTGDRVKDLARMSLKDTWLATNPIPLRTEQQVMEVLNMVRE